MYFYLLFSLLSTFLVLNIWFVEYIQSKIHPYSNAKLDEQEKLLSIVKLCLIIIMAFFWSAVIVNWG